jgi:PAS domain S-box-containing protein
MAPKPNNPKELAREMADLRARLDEAEQTLQAIRGGEVDALIVAGPRGDQVFSLKGAEAPYRVLIEEMNEGAVTLSAEGVILYCNRSFAELVKTPLDRVMGTAFNSFLAPGQLAAFTALLQAAQSGLCDGETTGRAGDGTLVPLHLSLNSLPAGSIGVVCIVATDLTETKQKEEALREHGDLEQRVAERTATLASTMQELIIFQTAALNMMEDAVEAKQALEAVNRDLQQEITEHKRAEALIKSSLKEKEVLLQEIHHRVKNNLQIISGLLTLQADRAGEKTVAEIFKDSQDRIHSIALIHEKLYQSKNLAEIDFGQYLRALLENLLISHGIVAGRITASYDMEPIPFTIEKAIPLGLIVNELVINILKHAFPDGRHGDILVRLHKCKGTARRAQKDGATIAEDKGTVRCAPTYELVIADNGIGLPENFVLEDGKSMGMYLVSMLVKQLQGELAIDRGAGTKFSFRFKDKLERSDGQG